MSATNYMDFRVEQDLLNCGLTPDALTAVRATSPIPDQCKMPDIESAPPSMDETMVQSESGETLKLLKQLSEQQQSFSRFKQFSDNRMMKLEHQLTSALEQLKHVSETITTLKSNQQARQVRQEATQTAKENFSEEPIDENNVAPADVRVDKIFYYGNN